MASITPATVITSEDKGFVKRFADRNTGARLCRRRRSDANVRQRPGRELIVRRCITLLGLALLFACGSQLAAQQVRSVVSTADLRHPMAAGAPFAFSSGAVPATGVNIAVDETQRFQTIDGFGASITDSAAYLIQQKLTPAARQRVLRMLFSPSRGMGLSFLRQPIGSEDLSRHHFTFDDMPKGQTDPTLAHFATPSEQAEIFATVRAAVRLNPRLTVMATPWSPPAWMKTGDTMDGGELLPAYEPVYARYLTRVLQAFEAAGVPVPYLTVQNEPLNDLPVMASAGMSAVQQARFIGGYLGPELRRAGLSTAMLVFDHSWTHLEYPLAVLADPKAAPFIAGSALHCYDGDASAQTVIHDAMPDKGIWMTECSGGTWDKEPPLIKTARVVIESTRNWAKAVVLWGVALDQNRGPWDGGCDTCRPLVTIDVGTSPATATYTGDLYGLGHASRFILPGAVRIQSTSRGRDSLQSVAFQNVKGTIALLLLNNASSPSIVTIAWHRRHATTALPPRSLTTYIWEPRS